MRIVSAGHAVSAALMIGIGIQGLITGEFTTVWQPVPKGAPAREVLVYLCALLSLASGIGAGTGSASVSPQVTRACASRAFSTALA